MLRTLLCSLAGCTLLVASGAQANTTISTLTLDGFSFVSFGPGEVAYFQPGSTIKFRFGTPQPDGSVSFTIKPEDVSIDPVPLPDGSGTLQYAITSTASGTMQPAADGQEINFSAVVRATLTTAQGTGSYDYAMPFTTDEGVATSIDGLETVSRTGVRIIDGVWYGQLVGTATNKEHAYPEPGGAVYTVLSGQFDTIPQ
jgi:hypothetical protein